MVPTFLRENPFPESPEITGLSVFQRRTSLFVPTLFGLYSKVPTAKTALGTLCVSVGVTLIVYFATSGAGFGILTPYAIGILCALAWMVVRMRTVDRARQP